LFGTERAVETSCADSGATVNAFSGAAPCCRVFDRGGRGRTRDFAPSCPSAATCSRRPVFPEPEKSLRKSGFRRPRGRWIGSWGEDFIWAPGHHSSWWRRDDSGCDSSLKSSQYVNGWGKSEPSRGIRPSCGV